VVPPDSGAFAAHDGVPYLWWPTLADAGVDAVVTTREGGVSSGPYTSLNLGLHVGDDPARVVENRRRALGCLAADPGHLAVATQVHGAAVQRVGASDLARRAADPTATVGEADALVTTEPGVVLGTLVADCAPVLLVDPVARVLATAHAGWRGATGGVLAATVGALRARGAVPGRLEVAVGPTVPAAGYQVGPEVAEAVWAVLGPRTPTLVDDPPGHWRFDLAGAVVALLAEAGVDPERIRRALTGTGDDGPFYSDRARRPCGRFALLARLRP
jgi:YfiH family protein